MPYVFTITGASGSGKSSMLSILTSLESSIFHPKIIPKYTTRGVRASEETEIINVPKLPNKCNIVYQQYNIRYGFPSSELYEALSANQSPLIILNDIRAIEDIKNLLGRLVVSIYLYRYIPDKQFLLDICQARGVSNQDEIDRRFRKSRHIFRSYIENIHLFNHVIINSGLIVNLERQLYNLINNVFSDNNEGM
jgi:guanylate kinase